MTKREPEIELRPDGWDRFTRAVDAGVKGGPKHRPAKRKTQPAHKGRVNKGRTRT